MIKVLVTEDSSVVRNFLKYVLNLDPDIEVIGTAQNGAEAVELALVLKPDVITMDIHMPRMDGFEATRRIMETNPVPIVICSASWNPEEVGKTFRSMEAGAVAALEKPQGMGHPNSASSVRELIRTIKAMSGIKVVRRWNKTARITRIQPDAEKETIRIKVKEDLKPVPFVVPKTDYEVKIVAIGASTGGPMALQTILAGLGKNFPVPVVIVQHIAQGFLSGLREWLQNSTGFSVRIAEDNEMLYPGVAYLAPDAMQMGVSKNNCVKIQNDPPENNLRPAVSYLFRSVVNAYGKQAIGVILTGMGRDGSEELGLFAKTGGMTIAQDAESSIVHGMPGEAIKLGHAKIIASISDVPVKLNQLIFNERITK